MARKLRLPIWIDYMGAALKSTPVAQPPAAPEGLARQGEDWIYAEWQGSGSVAQISDQGGVQYAQTPGAAIGDALSSFGAWLRGDNRP